MGDRPGIVSSLRQPLDSARQLLNVRLALLGTELEEQKLRLAQAWSLVCWGRCCWR